MPRDRFPGISIWLHPSSDCTRRRQNVPPRHDRRRRAGGEVPFVGRGRWFRSSPALAAVAPYSPAVTTMHANLLVDPAPLDQRPLRWAETERPDPGPGQLLIEVAGCGVCRSNLHMIEGDWVDGGVPAISPIIPGHEVTGRVAAVGDGVEGFAVGDPVGVSPLWWTCEECEFCTSGREQLCHQRIITGEHVDGGYGEFMLSHAAHTHPVPAGLDLVDAAPLFCPGLTAYGALDKIDVGPGDVVAVFGLGGVGHMAVQMAALTGAEVVAVGRTPCAPRGRAGARRGTHGGLHGRGRPGRRRGLRRRGPHLRGLRRGHRAGHAHPEVGRHPGQRGARSPSQGFHFNKGQTVKGLDPRQPRADARRPAARGRRQDPHRRRALPHAGRGRRLWRVWPTAGSARGRCCTEPRAARAGAPVARRAAEGYAWTSARISGTGNCAARIGGISSSVMPAVNAPRSNTLNSASRPNLELSATKNASDGDRTHRALDLQLVARGVVDAVLGDRVRPEHRDVDAQVLQLLHRRRSPHRVDVREQLATDEDEVRVLELGDQPCR